MKWVEGGFHGWRKGEEGQSNVSEQEQVVSLVICDRVKRSPGGMVYGGETGKCCPSCQIDDGGCRSNASIKIFPISNALSTFLTFNFPLLNRFNYFFPSIIKQYVGSARVRNRR